MFMLAGLVGGVVAAPIAVYASHSFTDVPGSNTFHADIAWLADAGVTKGCNPPANTQYCPDDNVSRGQMAAFMRRFAQYIDAEDGTPAQADNADKIDGKNASDFLGVNATAADSDQVDGYSANEMMRVAYFSTDNAGDSNGIAVATSIIIPKDGWLILNGSIDGAAAFIGDPNDEYNCFLAVNGATVEGTVRASVINAPGGTHTNNGHENCSTTGVHPVTGGTTVNIGLHIEFRTTVEFRAASVWALYVPFDGDGNTP
jgi:hypothetical protein